jgi:uncharacterized protein DUF1302
VSRLAILAAVALLGAPAAHADDELVMKLSGRVQTDLELRIDDKSVGAYYDHHDLPAGPERAQATLAFKLDAAYGRFKGVAQLDVVADAFGSTLTGVGDLGRIDLTNPVRIEANALYVDAKDIFVRGLDLRVGQQIVSWGVGDQFNPTNTLNPDDLRDRLLYGKQAATFMVKADYWLSDDWSLSAVLEPLFKPALLPRSAPLGPAELEQVPFVSDPLRWRIESETAGAAGVFGAPTVVTSATPVLPDPRLDEMPVAFRVAGTIGEQDIALSYYRGRNDFPVPYDNHTRYDTGAAQCDPANPQSCINGVIESEVKLRYPRMQVVGLNAAGEIPMSWLSEKLHGLGYRLEVGLFFPEESTVTISNDALALPVPQAAGEYDYDGDGVPGGPRPAAVADTPFAKWVVGLDYSFGKHWYVNGQWVHGLMDEFGAGDFFHAGRAVLGSGVTTSLPITLIQCALPKDGTTCARELYQPRLADYLVLGVDLKLVNNALLLRLFNILQLDGVTEETWDDTKNARVQKHHSPFSGDGFTAVVYPELNYNFGNGLDVGAGFLLLLGKTHTKFGDPKAGGSIGWARLRFAF